MTIHWNFGVYVYYMSSAFFQYVENGNGSNKIYLHIWATSIWRHKKSECCTLSTSICSTPQFPYFQCRRSFSMKSYEWMKASVLRHELSDVFTPGIWKGNERDVDQPWHRLTYANSWTISVGTNQVDNIHHVFREDASKSWKGNVSILHGFLLRGLFWLQEHREVFSSLNTSRFQLWLADESNFCPFSWGESSSVQQREIISFDQIPWSGFEMMTLQNVKNISHSLMSSQLGETSYTKSLHRHTVLCLRWSIYIHLKCIFSHSCICTGFCETNSQ